MTSWSRRPATDRDAVQRAAERAREAGASLGSRIGRRAGRGAARCRRIAGPTAAEDVAELTVREVGKTIVEGRGWRSSAESGILQIPRPGRAAVGRRHPILVSHPPLAARSR